MVLPELRYRPVYRPPVQAPTVVVAADPEPGFGALEPGAYRGLAAWWSREHWLSEVAGLLASPAGEVLWRGKVAVDVCQAVARVVAESADVETGRNAMPGNEALMAAVGRSRRGVQNALSVLRDLGVLVKVRPA